jgi:hypothetical protein
MTEVRPISTWPRFDEAHVAEAAGHLRKVFAGNFCIRLPAEAVVPEKLIDDTGIDRLPADEVNRRFANDPHIPCGIECIGHVSSLLLGELGE